VVKKWYNHFMPKSLVVYHELFVSPCENRKEKDRRTTILKPAIHTVPLILLSLSGEKENDEEKANDKDKDIKNEDKYTNSSTTSSSLSSQLKHGTCPSFVVHAVEDKLNPSTITSELNTTVIM
jgi:hypothetical protein